MRRLEEVKLTVDPEFIIINTIAKTNTSIYSAITTIPACSSPKYKTEFCLRTIDEKNNLTYLYQLIKDRDVKRWYPTVRLMQSLHDKVNTYIVLVPEIVRQNLTIA